MRNYFNGRERLQRYIKITKINKSCGCLATFGTMTSHTFPINVLSFDELSFDVLSFDVLSFD
jgi:hypothetical protein